MTTIEIASNDSPELAKESDLASWLKFEQCTYHIAITFNLVLSALKGGLIPIKKDTQKEKAIAGLQGLYKLSYNLYGEINSNVELIKQGKAPNIEIPFPNLPDPESLKVDLYSKDSASLVHAFWLAAEDVLTSVAQQMPDSPMKQIIAELVKDGDLIINEYFEHTGS